MSRFNTLNPQCKECQKFRKQEARYRRMLRIACSFFLGIPSVVIMYVLIRQFWLPMLPVSVNVLVVPLAVIMVFGTMIFVGDAQEINEKHRGHLSVAPGHMMSTPDITLNPQIHIHLCPPTDVAEYQVALRDGRRIRITPQWLTFPIGNPNLGSIREGSSPGWPVVIDPHLRWIRFDRHDGNFPWYAHSSDRLDVVMDALARHPDMYSLLVNYHWQRHTLRRFFIGIQATLRFMEETGAIERSAPLKESYRFLGYDFGGAMIDTGYYDDPTTKNDEVLATLGQVRRDLNLTYPKGKPKTTAA